MNKVPWDDLRVMCLGGHVAKVLSIIPAVWTFFNVITLFGGAPNSNVNLFAWFIWMVGVLVAAVIVGGVTYAISAFVIVAPFFIASDFFPAANPERMRAFHGWGTRPTENIKSSQTLLVKQDRDSTNQDTPNNTAVKKKINQVSHQEPPALSDPAQTTAPKQDDFINPLKPEDLGQRRLKSTSRATEASEGSRNLHTRFAIVRDQRLRAEAIAFHGNHCCVCGFSFDEAYGAELGRGYIEVHHLKPVAGGRRKTNARTDLAPLCANCHAMADRLIRTDEFLPTTISELRARLKSRE